MGDEFQFRYSENVRHICPGHAPARVLLYPFMLHLIFSMMKGYKSCVWHMMPMRTGCSDWVKQQVQVEFVCSIRNALTSRGR